MNAHVNTSIFHLKMAYKVGHNSHSSSLALCSDFLPKSTVLEEVEKSNFTVEKFDIPYLKLVDQG